LADAAKADYPAEKPNTSTAASGSTGARDVSAFKPVYPSRISPRVEKTNRCVDGITCCQKAVLSKGCSGSGD
jgi:hypothetical protein